jgi:hypothetical protein
MSLIRVRRARKKNWIDARRGMQARRLGWFFLLVVALIWYLAWRF